MRKRTGTWDESQTAEQVLLQALRRAADLAGFIGDERLAFFASATHQEIALGALAEKDEIERALHPEEHVHVYVRQISCLPKAESARAFLDWDMGANKPDALAHERLQTLKSELEERLPKRYRRFTTHWQGNDIDSAYLDEFCRQFLEDHKAVIEREFTRIDTEAASEKRNRLHFEFGAVNRPAFCRHLGAIL